MIKFPGNSKTLKPARRGPPATKEAGWPEPAKAAPKNQPQGRDLRKTGQREKTRLRQANSSRGPQGNLRKPL